MPRVARKGDPVFCENDSHITIGGIVSNPVQGIIEQGSSNVYVNSVPAARFGDAGMHGVCLGNNSFIVVGKCAEKTFVNSLPLAHYKSETYHCSDIPGAGVGYIQSNCSTNTFVEEK